MPQISRQALIEIEEALKRYEEEVERSMMAPTTKRTYLSHSREFVRWLDDDFRPGEKTG